MVWWFAAQQPQRQKAAVRCFRCGGPHFKLDRKSGRFCTAQPLLRQAPNRNFKSNNVSMTTISSSVRALSTTSASTSYAPHRSELPQPVQATSLAEGKRQQWKVDSSKSQPGAATIPVELSVSNSAAQQNLNATRNEVQCQEALIRLNEQQLEIQTRQLMENRARARAEKQRQAQRIAEYERLSSESKNLAQLINQQQQSLAAGRQVLVEQAKVIEEQTAKAEQAGDAMRQVLKLIFQRSLVEVNKLQLRRRKKKSSNKC
jgi:hypothetical protein